jgi:hypothetical protein
VSAPADWPRPEPGLSLSERHSATNQEMSADEKRRKLAFAISEFLESQKASFADDEKAESLSSTYCQRKINEK